MGPIGAPTGLNAGARVRHGDVPGRPRSATVLPQSTDRGIVEVVVETDLSPILRLITSNLHADRAGPLGARATRAAQVLAAAAGLSALGACSEADPDAARQAWLVETVVRENQVWLSRNPELLAHKFEKMARSPWYWMRGTVGLYLQDDLRAGTERRESELTLGGGLDRVLLVGDPHLENFGTLSPDPGAGPNEEEEVPAQLVLDWNDLDAAAFGPYPHDLRRAALGLALVGASLPGCDVVCRDEAVTAFGEGYLQGLQTQERGREEVVAGEVLSHLREKAEEKGRAREELMDSLDVNGRWLRRDIELDEEHKGLMEAGIAEKDQLSRLIPQVEACLPGTRVLDGVRKFGTGVSSLPATRFLLLVEGPDGEKDLLGLREVVDPPAYAGAQGVIPGFFADSGERIEGAPALLWGRPDADPRLCAVADGGQLFKTTSASAWFRGLDHEKIQEKWAEGDWNVADLSELGASLGDALGGTHRRSPTAEGEAAGPLIAAQLSTHSDLFLVELRNGTREEVARNEADYALFVAALDQLGPLLGAETWMGGQ